MSTEHISNFTGFQAVHEIGRLRGENKRMAERLATVEASDANLRERLEELRPTGSGHSHSTLGDCEFCAGFREALREAGNLLT